MFTHNILQGALPWQFLDHTYHKYVGQYLLSNARQLGHQVAGNRAISCGSDGQSDWRETKLNDKLRRAAEYLDKGSVTKGIREGDEAIAFGKEALSYFRQYQRTRFLIYLSIMWLGWILVLFLKIVNARTRRSISPLRHSLSQLTNIGFVVLLTITLVSHIGKRK